MTDIQRLLREYVDGGSEAAFRELVERHLNLVYSTALRLVDGDTHLAQDVTQTVFIDLAHFAKKLSGEVRLGGWLHRHTCFVAAKTLRGERRRRARERKALEMNEPPIHSEERLGRAAPLLDEAINHLGPADRAAIVLRFYEGLDFRLIGEALGTSEAAAQKRVSRALEKLHLLLKRRGIAYSAAALGAAMTGEAVTAAPAALAASVPSVALASAASGTGSALTLLKFMAATKLQTGIAVAVIAASVVTPFLVQHQAQAKLREQDHAWQWQNNQLAQLTADNQRLTDLLAQAKNTQTGADDQLAEVLRLRSQVGRLRANVQQMTAELTAPKTPKPEDQLASLKTMYAARVDRLKQWFEANPSQKIPELTNDSQEVWLNAVEQLESDDDLARAARFLRNDAEQHVLSQLDSALRKFAQDNNGRFPTDLSQLTPYLKTPIDDATLQRYEIVPASSLIPELQPGGDWAITQKAPVDPALDMREAVGLTGEMGMADERVTNRWTLIH